MNTNSSVRRHNPWMSIEKWLRTAAGEEFCDELVWGSASDDDYGELLKEHGLNDTPGNRSHLKEMIDNMLRRGEV